MQKKKVVIISVDALNAHDFHIIKKLPNFSKFLHQGTIVRDVDSIYPSLTYPCHTSILTGCYPKKHGIIHNEKADITRATNQNWFWYYNDIKVPTLFSLAAKKGYKNGAVLWPVMGGAKKIIPYLVPEIWSIGEDSTTTLFLKNGSLCLLPSLLKHKKLMNGIQQPYLDNFAEAIAKDILSKKKPDIMAIHFTDLDARRHYQGLNGSHVEEALSLIDTRIGHIFDVVANNGNLEDTTFIVLGDHGGNDFSTAILLNNFFVKASLITKDDANNILDWKAYANGNGGSAQIHLSDPTDFPLHTEVEQLLFSLKNLKESPIKEIYTVKEAKEQYGLSGSFSFVVEAKDGYSFRNYFEPDVLLDCNSLPTPYALDHGFLPTHPNLHTMMMGLGPTIPKNQTILRGKLVDIAPTIGHFLDIEFENIDGEMIENFFIQ